MYIRFGLFIKVTLPKVSGSKNVCFGLKEKNVKFQLDLTIFRGGDLR